MSKITLPVRPNLEQLKKQAKELLSSVRKNEPEAVRLFAEYHPALKQEKQPFALHDAQLVLARQHGFVNWAKLKEEVERLTSDFSERVRRFVVDATDDDFEHAQRALAVEPDLARANFWTALVMGDREAVRRHVERDVASVNRTDGPCIKWTPLLYVCFSRFQGEGEEAKIRFTACAKLLLEAGADANASWAHPFWPTSQLKSLYGATGTNNNPPLARLLIAHGAELNDGESIYHAAQFDHRESMETLREAGVSFDRHPQWKNTPLYFLLGAFKAQGSWPASKRGIRWLLDHGCDPNIPCGDDNETALHVAIRQDHELTILCWLLEAGADPNLANKNGLLPLKLAYRSGRSDIVEVLKEFGAHEVEVSLKERFFGAALSGHADVAAQLLHENADLRSSFEEDDLLSLNRAAERGYVEAVRTLLDCGFDISFKGTREWGSTPLHAAAWHGQADVVDLLLAHGAPIDIPANEPEPSLAFGWAAHGSNHCKNPRGDYPRIIHALLAAGAEPHPEQANMASQEVADIIHTAVAGREL